MGDSKTAEERKQKEKNFIDAVKIQLAFGRKFKSIVELRKFAERHGLKDIKDTDLQELVETTIVQRARTIASSEATDNTGKFKRIKNLYENQPSLNQRDSERVKKQQYSTPAPYAFLGYLYSHYNVEDVINVDGSLYAKQGTSYPTRIILINGRRKYDPEHKVFPPVEKDAKAEAVKDYDELYKRIEDDILRERGVQKEPLGLSNRERSSDVPRDSLRQKERSGNGVTNNKEYGSGPDGGISDLGTGGSDERPMGETERTSSKHMGDNAELESGRDSDFVADRGTGSASSRLDNGGRVPEGTIARNANETSNERGAGGDRKLQGEQGRSSSSVQRTFPSREGNGLGVKKEESPKRELSTEKVKYVPQSNNPYSLNSVVPADPARATKKALEKIGDVDGFLVEELGYKYAKIQYIDTFKYDENANPVKKYDDLNSIIDSLESKLKDIEQKYGFNRKSNINEIKSAIGTETAEGDDSRGMEGVPEGDSVRISGRKRVLSDYKKTALSLAAAQRAKEYLLERFNNIRLKYGLEEGDWASKEQVERIFNGGSILKQIQKMLRKAESFPKM